MGCGLISFVCIYDDKDGVYIPSMLNSLPQTEVILCEVIKGVEDYTKFIYQNGCVKSYEIGVKDFNFADVRNIAKDFATNDWIFSIDADERLQYDQHNHLFEVIKLDCEAVSMKVYDPNINKGAEVVRLFKKHLNWVGYAHEQIITDKLVKTNLLIRHDGYANLSKEQQHEKSMRNLSLMLKDVENNNKKYWLEKIISTAKTIDVNMLDKNYKLKEFKNVVRKKNVDR